MNTKYQDIIDMPHHVSARHKQMSREARAAQFAPFAALTGFDGEIDEAGRYTNERAELDENEKALLDQRLTGLAARLGQKPLCRVVWFKADVLKCGGSYKKNTGHLTGIDRSKRMLTFDNGLQLPIQDIVELEEL